FDARANGLEGIFSTRLDATGYRARPANLDVEELNLAGAYGQAECDAMNFKVADEVPFDRLNEILWRTAHSSGPPPPVRSGFALGAAGPGDRDELQQDP
ncbi:MAG TPA: hypothetical protein VMJ70_08230, partial [Candidatus Sulfotelmatobacter sp.]|nr:hypothetical protein [Candidatus Sulfotelmatobacter sp.]